MPRIQLTSTEVQKKYRDHLLPKQQRLFDRLVRLLAEPRTDLRWYHEVGRQVQGLRPESPRSSEGQLWSRALSQALGPATGLLYKTSQFVQLYPQEAEVERLERLGAAWNLIVLTLPIAHRKDRYRLIREAVREGWDQKKLRLEIQKRHPSRRKGMGGRPRKVPENFGPEINLRELDRLARYWLEFFEKAWEEVEPRAWTGMVQGCPEAEREKLQELLERTEKHLSEVGKSCQEMRRTLAALLQEIK